MRYADIRFPLDERIAVDTLNRAIGGAEAIEQKTSFQDFEDYQKFEIATVRTVRLRRGTLSTFAGNSAVDAEPLTHWTDSQLAEEEASLDREFDQAAETLNRYADMLARIKACQQVVEAVRQYREWTPPDFCREWKKQTRQEGKLEIWTISNLVYEMWAQLDLQYGKVLCSYTARTRPVQPGNNPEILYVKRVLDKKFKTETEARDYLDARRKYYWKKCFAEDCPALPDEIASCFTWAGMLLPGYRMKGDKRPRCATQQTGPCDGRNCAACKGCAEKGGEKNA